MKVTAIDRTHALDATRGRRGTVAAGADGMVWRDASTESTGRIRDMTVVGADFLDNEDGTGVLTIGGTGSGTPGDIPGRDWNNVEDYGAVHDGTTNDTASIQAAIDAAAAAGGGVIYFPPGTYIVGGALQDTGGFNGQLLLPNVVLGVDPQIVLTFLGASRPGFEWFGDKPEDTNLSIIKSTLTGASGTAAMISGGPTTGYLGWNNISTVWKDLLILVPDNPTFTALNLASTQGGALENVQVAAPGALYSTSVQPTNSNSYGVKLPQIGASAYTETRGLAIGGFYTCLLDGELAIHKGFIASTCIVAIEVPHLALPPMHISDTIVSFQYGIRGTGASAINFINLAIAHTPGSPTWKNTIYDLDDPSNYLSGMIRHYVLDNVTGLEDPFLRNGGTGVQSWRTTKLGPDSGVTAGSYTAANVTVDVFGRVTAASSGSASQHILLADGHATPFTFNDLLQMDDGSDFMWSDS